MMRIPLIWVQRSLDDGTKFALTGFHLLSSLGFRVDWVCAKGASNHWQLTMLVGGSAVEPTVEGKNRNAPKEQRSPYFPLFPSAKKDTHVLTGRKLMLETTSVFATASLSSLTPGSCAST